MSLLFDAAGSLGAGLGGMVADNQSIERQSRHDALIMAKHKQLLAEKERSTAKELYTFDEKQAQTALGGAQPDYERAATIMRRAQPNLNTYTGRNDEAPTLMGSARPAMPDLRPTQRPADAAASNPFAAGQQFGMGAVPGVDDEAASILRRPLTPPEPAPTPEPSTFGAPREADFGGPTDYANPENQATIQRWANYTPPKAEYKAYGPGQSVYRHDPATGAPDATPAFHTAAKPTTAKQVRVWDAAANGWRYEDQVPGKVYPDKPNEPRIERYKPLTEQQILNMAQDDYGVDHPKPEDRQRFIPGKPKQPPIDPNDPNDKGIDAKPATWEAGSDGLDDSTNQPMPDALKIYRSGVEALRKKYRDAETHRSRMDPANQGQPGGGGGSFNQPSRGGIRPRGVAGNGGTAAWAPTIKQASEQYGVPYEIVEAVMRQESGGQQTRNGRTLTSPAGALGLMQLMPGTARGLKVNAHDAAQNIMGGVKYLRQMYDQTGSWEQAIAAYNGGLSSTGYSRDKGHEHERKWANPNNHGWDETKNYVKRIKADLKRQGIEISAVEAGSVANLLDRYNLTPGGANA